MAIGVFMGFFLFVMLAMRDGFRAHYLMLLPLFGIVGGMFGLIFGRLFGFLTGSISVEGVRVGTLVKRHLAVAEALSKKWKIGERPDEKYRAIDIVAREKDVRELGDKGLVKCRFCAHAVPGGEIHCIEGGFICKQCIEREQPRSLA